MTSRYVTYDQAADKRRLIHVTFERQSPDASAPTIEVVYEVRFPDEGFLADDTAVVNRISVTLTDTKELVSLTPEERDLCDQAATEKAAELLRED